MGGGIFPGSAGESCLMFSKFLLKTEYTPMSLRIYWLSLSTERNIIANAV